MHKPVMLREVMEYLDPQPGQNFIDCTFGGGGHAAAIAQRVIPNGKILGIDADVDALEKFKIQNSKFKNNIILTNDNFRNLKTIYERNFPYSVDGILCDLGLSSMELDDPTRGFSFKSDGPLDMRFDRRGQKLTAADILNSYTRERLEKIFIDFGEVDAWLARRVAESVVKMRREIPFATTWQFVATVLEANYGEVFLKGKITVETENFYRRRRKIIHPATKFFQALRIEVNDELGSLDEFLQVAAKIIGPGGRMAVIAFHSLEDRMVKQRFREWAHGGGFELLTKKPVSAGEDEISANPRARSGRLRVIRKIDKFIPRYPVSQRHHISHSLSGSRRDPSLGHKDIIINQWIVH